MMITKKGEAGNGKKSDPLIILEIRHNGHSRVVNATLPTMDFVSLVFEAEIKRISVIELILEKLKS
jgi:hypothetical protein